MTYAQFGLFGIWNFSLNKARVKNYESGKNTPVDALILQANAGLHRRFETLKVLNNKNRNRATRARN